MKTALYLASIAALVAFAQTMDYREMKAIEAEQPDAHAIYIDWHKEMMNATANGVTEAERQAYIEKWKQENPELAPIISTRWRDTRNTQKVAQK